MIDLRHIMPLLRNRDIPEFQGARLCVLLEEVVEMCDFRKPESKCDFRNTLCAVTQQDPGFLQDTFGYKLCCCFLNSFLYCAIQVIDVNVELVGEIGG